MPELKSSVMGADGVTVSMGILNTVQYVDNRCGCLVIKRKYENARGLYSMNVRPMAKSG